MQRDALFTAMVAGGVPRTLADEILNSPPAEIRSNVLAFIGEERARAAASRAKAAELLTAAARIDALVGEMSAAVGVHYEARADEPLALAFDATIHEVGSDLGGVGCFVRLACGRQRPRFQVTEEQAKAAARFLYRTATVTIEVK